MTISMYHLCNNPDEWFEPSRFIPERFESTHAYFLTPKGTRRNPFSFSPFLGGSRICIGKTFIEAVSKLTVPILLQGFNFEFPEGVNKDTYQYPHNNLTATWTPKVPVLISKRDL